MPSEHCSIDQGYLRFMVAAFSHQMEVFESSGTATSDIFVQSRWIGLCAGGMSLPFLLAAPAAKPMHALLVMAALLLPSAAALLMSRLRSVPAAAFAEVLISGCLALGFTMAGFGPACSLALLAFALIDYKAGATPDIVPRWVMLGAIVIFAGIWLAIERSSAAATIGLSYGAASLALLPPFIQAFVMLQLRKNAGVEPTASASSEVHALSTATLKYALETALLLDRSGRVLALGRNAPGNLGSMAHELLGRGLFERLHLLDRPQFLKLCAQINQNSPQHTARLRLRLDAPHPETRLVAFVDLDARIIPPEDDAGHILIFLSKARVVSAVQSARAGDDVDVSDRYLGDISHYIRTPLNAIIGFADLLSSPTTQPKEPGTIAEYGEIIHESGHTLLQITDTLIDMVRLKSGSYVLAPQALDPVAIVQAAENDLRTYFGEKQLSLHIESIDVEGEWIADRQAAVAVMAGAAAAMMDVSANWRVAVRVSAIESVIRFQVLPTGALALGALAEGGFRNKLSPRSGLMFEQAQALARYQGGTVTERRSSDGSVDVEACLPLSLAEDKNMNAPVSLDRFRRGKGEQGRNSSETVVKKHA